MPTRYALDFGEQEKPVLGHLCLQGYGCHLLLRNGNLPKLPVFGTNIASDCIVNQIEERKQCKFVIKNDQFLGQR